MNISKTLILPLTFSSILAASTALANSEMERTHHDAQEETISTYKDVKKNTKETWADIKEGSKKIWANTQEAYDDGVISGKLETALILNEHLNPFRIDIDVEGKKVALEGEVDSEIEKDLAENIAKGIKGVSAVDNRITVNKNGDNKREGMSESKDRDFSQYMADVSTTASIKTELFANDNVSGLDIDVDTFKDRVVLSGEVKTKAQKSLAEKIVKKRKNVTQVVNNLMINS